MFFLDKIKNIVDYEKVLEANVGDVNALYEAKKIGFSDKYIGILWKMTEDGEYARITAKGRAAALFTSVLGTVYACWLLYAAGLKYLFLAVIFLALGVPVFVWARRQSADGKPVFGSGEKVVVTLLVLCALVAVYVFARGLVSV